jgi:acyl-CoA thioester hydrolase
VEIVDICRIPVKFSELDPMRRVWHGNYVKYMEDGRESFGRHYPGCDYTVMMETGITAPVYEVKYRCLAPLEMNDVAVIHTTYVPRRGARLDYRYQIFRERDGALCLEGSTIQLFIDQNGEQMLEEPFFFADWKKKMGF